MGAPDPAIVASPATAAHGYVIDDDERAQIERDIEGYLRKHEQKELMRFVVVGSVDDGKSTLIGRLLHDTHGIYEDQLSAVKRASAARGATRGEASAGEIDLSLFTDGLKAEREQGITIDVAYRYFSTARRKFIIADTPGHVQYTRNMATGASTADVAIILVDARLGILPQSRRHAFIASLLGIPHLLVCVNKMDLQGYSQEVFTTIEREMGTIAQRLGFSDVTAVPISGLRGDNVVHKSAATPWYTGSTVLGYLEELPVNRSRNMKSLRYPVQYVIRPDLSYRGFAGQVASGELRKGDELLALPSGRRSRVASIDTREGPVELAFAPMSVSIRLTDEMDVSRGDMLVHPGDLPQVGTRFHAHVVWMNERPLDPGKSYLLKHTTRMVRIDIEKVEHLIDSGTLEPHPAERLGLNDIGRVTLACHQPIYFDAYVTNRATGAFILIDSLTNDTVGAGMIIGPAEGAGRTAGGPRGQIGDDERRERLGQLGELVEVRATTLERAQQQAYAIERVLFDERRLSAVTTLPAASAVARAGLIALVPSEGPDQISVGGVPFDQVPGDEEELGKRVLDALAARGLLGPRPIR